MKLFSTAAFAASLLFAASTPALSDVIVGNWKTQSGETAAITKCGGSFCIRLKTGTYSGKQIGKMAGGNGTYDGTVTDPADDKVYTGSASVKGSSMRLKGCALKVFCRTQTWRKI